MKVPLGIIDSFSSVETPGEAIGNALEGEGWIPVSQRLKERVVAESLGEQWPATGICFVYGNFHTVDNPRDRCLASSINSHKPCLMA